MKVYLIEAQWVDSMENRPSAAVGRTPIGFTWTEWGARRIVAKGGLLRPGYPFAGDADRTRYRYRAMSWLTYTRTLDPMETCDED